ncbi:hypothetical protein C7S16_1965 [Burkholderia thailandensis]|uniref:Uncharacterized protein n=1 Tax=Burkholderia thailandensis TaxID=57975 RepID=A0AAW9D5L8_BURTH|nr:hypothetical protein [Burkholderia thailandensis]MDW9257269.1 hypothetical protein [Burkholderia thailandensis]
MDVGQPLSKSARTISEKYAIAESHIGNVSSIPNVKRHAVRRRIR